MFDPLLKKMVAISEKFDLEFLFFVKKYYVIYVFLLLKGWLGNKLLIVFKSCRRYVGRRWDRESDVPMLPLYNGCFFFFKKPPYR